MNSEHGKIAVIGMACRFPGANNIDEYWDNLLKGKETIKHFKDEELQDHEIDYDKLKNDPNFVPARGILNNIDKFDAHFFGMPPQEASLTDPQHRVWLETVWAAFENAGCNPYSYKGNIGVYAGGYTNTYLLNNILRDSKKYENYIRLRTTESYQIAIANNISHLPTKTAYQFNLKGPAVNVQTACSTSLVAIAHACNSLYSFESDICIAGGICILTPQESGYIYHEGAIPSPDGHCRPFDEQGQGTVFSNGVGVVILKRIEDAIKDNDHIYAMVDGWALNNDGNKKVSYTAPSVQGQEEVILMAQSFAGIKAEEIGYIEAHGTATNLGDPIEVKALTNAFSRTTSKKQFCGIGSVKSNIGHTDAAAGVASFIKICLATYHKTIPPTINFKKPNSHINFKDSPFYVNDKLKKWENGEKLISGISSFGLGGTNAHCILEEWQSDKSIVSEKELHILPLSSKSAASLESMTENLIHHLKTSNRNIGDIAHTLQTGRNFYNHRTALLGRDINEIINNYESLGTQGLVKGVQKMTAPTTVFMFTGQGSQYVNMAKGLYEAFGIFKNIVDNAHDILLSDTKINLKGLLFNDSTNKNNSINLTSNAQPLLFTIQYATARLLMDIGIYPDALIGHSTGQIAAATLSGIFSFEDALKFITIRGEMMQNQKSGLMLSVNLSPKELWPYLNGTNVELALHNAPEYCVVSGPNKDINNFHDFLKKEDENIHTTLIKAPGAYHSKAMDPVLEPIMEIINDINLCKPEIPLISNLSGTWIEEEEACSPKYWADHIRSTVKFSDGISEIFQSKDEIIFLELGPGNSLSILLSQFENQNRYESISTIRHPLTQSDDVLTFYKAISNFWIRGGRIDWDKIYENEVRYKVPLPTYPFERNRHWIDIKSTYDFKIACQENIEESVPNEKKDDVVEILQSIWRKHFGNIDIAITDYFRELGGQSLLAFSIINDIEKQFGIKISFQKFLAGLNSIEKVASFIKMRLQKEDDKIDFDDNLNHIYCLRPKGNSIPLFSIFNERLFSDKNALRNIPIYDFVWPGSDGRPFTMDSVEEIAQSYLEEILKVYPDGPFYLIGFSFGGYIAFEIALRLQKMGYEVPIVALIDTMHPQLKISFVQKYKHKIKKHGILKLSKRIFNVVKHQTKDKIRNAQLFILLKKKKKLPANLTQVMIFNESKKIISKYRPKFFNGNIHLFKSTDLLYMDSEFLGWQSNVIEVNTIQLVGGHTATTSVNDNKKNIISEIEKMINEVEK